MRGLLARLYHRLRLLLLAALGSRLARGRITASVMYTILGPWIRDNQLVVDLDDSVYLAPTRSAFARLAAAGFTQYLEYRPEFRDCDDYAKLFVAYCYLIGGITSVGTVRTYDGTPHKFVVCVTRELDVLWWEPQTATPVAPNSGPLYLLRKARVAI